MKRELDDWEMTDRRHNRMSARVATLFAVGGFAIGGIADHNLLGGTVSNPLVVDPAIIVYTAGRSGLHSFGEWLVEITEE